MLGFEQSSHYYYPLLPWWHCPRTFGSQAWRLPGLFSDALVAAVHVCSVVPAFAVLLSARVFRLQPQEGKLLRDRESALSSACRQHRPTSVVLWPIGGACFCLASQSVDPVLGRANAT